MLAQDEVSRFDFESAGTCTNCDASEWRSEEQFAGQRWGAARRRQRHRDRYDIVAGRGPHMGIPRSGN